MGLNERAPRPDIIFPVEIWSQILQYVHASTGQKAFAPMVRISRGIRPEAETVLYRAPFVFTTAHAVSFGATIAACPRLALAVRSLIISPYSHASQDVYTDAIVPALHKLTRLSSLYVYVDTSHVGRGHCALSLLRGVSIPLKSIRGMSFSLDDDNVEVLDQFPDLEEIHVRSQDVQGFHSLSRLHLPKLRILETDFASLRGMTAPPGRVTHLSISKALNHASLVDTLKLFGTNLVSLGIRRALEEYEGRMYPTAAFPWEKFTSLKYLYIEDAGRSALYIPEEATDFDSHRPPTLETLVWKPAWTQGSMRSASTFADGDTQGARRRDIRRFARAALLNWPSLRAVLYGWQLSDMMKVQIGRGASIAIEQHVVHGPLDPPGGQIQTLLRDDCRCMATGHVDLPSSQLYPDIEPAPMRSSLRTECCHVFPESLGKLGARDADRNAAVRKELSSSKIHRWENVMTLTANTHRLLDDLELWSEAVQGKEHCYRVNAPILRGTASSVPSEVPFVAHRGLSLRNPEWLRIHAPCARVAHMCGAREYMDLAIRRMEETRVLAEEGSEGSVETLMYAMSFAQLVPPLLAPTQR
ncbi:hypothetical protein BN946_scf184876.g3 [Trametes cinnabarina]|uniref:HNH nuclease domain-containing protein n=1 Tax=Pycnoporus cinnabarinus TaxID=5643 RepID=A0A060SNZ4_PYCCI|nr:hypothetical protein BN946_scf184876.g3 [Trametes cinnabarina]